jgi:hypothetical protein
LPGDEETIRLFVNKVRSEGLALARRLATAGYDYSLIREVCGLD